MKELKQLVKKRVEHKKIENNGKKIIKKQEKNKKHKKTKKKITKKRKNKITQKQEFSKCTKLGMYRRESCWWKWNFLLVTMM